MSNRDNTFLSDENMRKICFEGRPVPLDRLDLMLPPQMNTSPVYSKPTGTNPRMERATSVTDQIATLSRASGISKDTLFELYRKTLENKKDVKMDFAAVRRLKSTPTRYIPDITDEIMRILLEAQVFSGDLVPQPPEGERPEPTFLTQTRLLTEPELPSDPELPSYTELTFPHRFQQFYPPVGLEAEFGFETRAFNPTMETTRRIKESAEGRPAMAPLTGSGRPRAFELGNIGESSEPINIRRDPDVIRVN